jgi:imidazolonepropionase-like amidohydrolase
MTHKCIGSLAVLAVLGGASTVLAQTKRIKPRAEALLVKCKVLINPVNGSTIEDAAIQLNNGKIMKVGRAAEFGSLPGYRVVDYSDKYVIPGLIDTHAHMYGGIQFRITTNENGPVLLLASGVTTACGPGSMDPGGDLAMRRRIDTGFWEGPRYFLAGEYLEMDPVTVRWMNPLFTPEEARLKIDYWAQQGATAIKMYARMSGEIMRASAEHAHEQGLRVFAHVGATEWKDAIEMGVDELFHGVLALPEGMPKDFSGDGSGNRDEAIAHMDLNQPQIREALRLAAERKVVLSPTAVVREPIDMQKQHMEDQKRFFVPSTWEIIEKMAKQPPSPVVMAVMKKQREFIKAADQAGCILATGTDYVVWRLLPGYSLWREMELFAEAGVQPMKVLKAATWAGAYAIGRTDQLGSIEPGKLADFVALNANPLDNITNVRSVYRVVKGGVIYDPQELLKSREGKIF